MSDLDALLAGIVANPHEELRWLVLADWLDDHGQPERAELLRLHRELLRTCTAEPETKAHKQLHTRVLQLLKTGTEPCIPRWTLGLPGEVELRMVFVPPGRFLMGRHRKGKGNATRHVVTLTRGFWLGVTPVTQRQWGALMGTDPSFFKGNKLPVECVSWYDAVAFCEALKKRTAVEARLPNEAEWEYAARAGTTTAFYWGGKLNGTQANCNGNYPYGSVTKGPYLETTTVVGSYASMSPHPWGLADMAGNVTEWCSDWYASYPDGEATDPLGPNSGLFRVLRGGCWRFGATSCRAASRAWDEPGNRYYNFGFRVVVVPSGV